MGMIERKYGFLFCMAVCAAALSGCIAPEAPNAEADIVRCLLDGNIITDSTIDYYASYSESLNAYPLEIEVSRETDLRSLAPRFELSPGAVIVPESGTVRDFTRRQRYTVTSEDGQWQKTYSVSIHHTEVVDLPDILRFDTYRVENGYHVLYDGELDWCSGNRGFRMTNSGAAANEYPTYCSPTGGHTGGCAVMVTRSTGSLGAIGGKPIAAGNLFIGSFDASTAMMDPLGSTRFGVAYTRKPVAVEGWYRYEPGPKFYENGEYTDRVDCGNMNFAFFERTGSKSLDGHTSNDNWTDGRIVAYGGIAAIVPAAEWTRFRVELEYRAGKPVDEALLAAGGYGLTLVFSSSAGGGSFCGAVGSTLMIDDVSVIYE